MPIESITYLEYTSRLTGQRPHPAQRHHLARFQLDFSLGLVGQGWSANADCLRSAEGLGGNLPVGIVREPLQVLEAALIAAEHEHGAEFLPHTRILLAQEGI